MNITHLSIKWTVSRGRDTYGYNICKLTSNKSGKTYKCNGGGYDMTGTVFGEWLATEYQTELQTLVSSLRLKAYGTGTARRVVDSENYADSFYGLTVRENNTVSLDGACGLDAMKRIAEALGLEVQWEGDIKGRTLGYFVAPKEVVGA